MLSFCCSVQSTSSCHRLTCEFISLKLERNKLKNDYFLLVVLLVFPERKSALNHNRLNNLSWEVLPERTEDNTIMIDCVLFTRFSPLIPEVVQTDQGHLFSSDIKLESAIILNSILASLFEVERLQDGFLIYDTEETDVWHGAKYSSGDAYARAYLFGDYLGDHIDLALRSSGHGTIYLIKAGEVVKEILIEPLNLEVVYEIAGIITDFFKLPRLEPLSPPEFNSLLTKLKREASRVYQEFPGREIKYGHVYTDDDGFYYRIVKLSRDAYEKMIREYGDRILTVLEWRSLGIEQMLEWQHIFSDMRSFSLIFRI